MIFPSQLCVISLVMATDNVRFRIFADQKTSLSFNLFPTAVMYKCHDKNEYCQADEKQTQVLSINAVVSTEM